MITLSDLHYKGDLKRKYRPCVTIRNEFNEVVTITTLARERPRSSSFWVWSKGQDEPGLWSGGKVEVLSIG